MNRLLEAFKKVSRSELIELLNQDLSREYQIMRTRCSSWSSQDSKRKCSHSGLLRRLQEG
jgi:predicted nucleic acid-binding Zn ribbon protein